MRTLKPPIELSRIVDTVAGLHGKRCDVPVPCQHVVSDQTAWQFLISITYCVKDALFMDVQSAEGVYNVIYVHIFMNAH